MTESAAAERLWIKDPIATLGEGAERGVVVAGGRIVELRRRRAPSPRIPSTRSSMPRATS